MQDSVLKTLLNNVWLFSNVFWKYSDQLAFNRSKEKAKVILANVYWYTDIHLNIPPEIDTMTIERNLKILQNFYEPQEEEKTWLFNKK